MKLKFSKMHGLGNDFVVIDAVNQEVALTPAQVRFLADRHVGVGCDQLLLVERPGKAEVDFRYRIFNADGGEVEQCGNGARCFARFVRDHGLSNKSRIPVETNSGDIVLEVEADGQVTVDMGVPRFEPDALPFVAARREARYFLEVADEVLEIGAVSLGNPHAVLKVADVDTAPVQALGREIERHPRFPRHVNAGFMQILDQDHIRLRVFERGVGETQACGTGACAAMAVGRLWGLLGEEVRVDLTGGSLLIRWPGEGEPLLMTGPAEEVFQGEIELS